MNTVYFKKRLLKRDGDRCHYCGSKMKFDGLNGPISATIEHLKRKADGGGNKLGNLVLACKACNGIRGTIDAGHLPKYIGRGLLINRLKSQKLTKLVQLVEQHGV